MKMNKLISAFSLLIVIYLVTSCDSRPLQDIEGIVANPTYTKNIKPILDAKCVNCHSQSGEGIFPDLDTYQSVVNAQNGIVSSKLFCSISSSSCTTPRMPKGDAPLSNGAISTIKNWIDTNYPEN
jgi:hypothetical protein